MEPYHWRKCSWARLRIWEWVADSPNLVAQQHDSGTDFALGAAGGRRSSSDLLQPGWRCIKTWVFCIHLTCSSLSNLLPPSLCNLDVNLRKFPRATQSKQPKSLSLVVISSLLGIRNGTVHPWCFFTFLFCFLIRKLSSDTFCRTSSTDLYFPALIRKACWLILGDIAENPLKSGSAMGSLKLWVSWYHSLHLDFISAKYQSWAWYLWGFPVVIFRQVASLILGFFWGFFYQICYRVST